MVLVTTGDKATTIVTADGAVAVPVEAVPVVDTIGAGDAFTAGFASWWVAGGRGRDDLRHADALVAAVRAAHAVAAVVVGRRGADPPTARRTAHRLGVSDRSPVSRRGVGSVVERHEQAGAWLTADAAADVALPGAVLGQQDRARAEDPPLAGAGLDLDRPGEVDDELATRRVVEVDEVVAVDLAELDAGPAARASRCARATPWSSSSMSTSSRCDMPSGPV